MPANLELLLLLAEHLLLTGLPAAAAALWASRAGVRSVPLLLAIALAVSGGVAILEFWLFYADPLIGKSGAYFFALGSVVVLGWCWREGIDRDVLTGLATPFALWTLASGFVLFLGYLHGGSGLGDVAANARFSHELPTDNDIPRYFADYFYLHGHSGTPPPFGDWLSSDRPPLQIGYVLFERPFGWDPALHYEVLGVVVQQLWVLGMWALLCAAGLRARTRGLVAFAAIVSDVAIVHGFFVWPKLIAAAFLLAALALLFDDRWKGLRREPLGGVLFAALIGLAMLAHGSSAFFALPLVAVALWTRPSWSWVGTAVVIGVVLLGSWSAYQRYADPPGDRLIKWQLGGSLEIDNRSALQTIADSYREEGVGGTLDNKWGNVTTIVDQGEDERAVREAADFVGEGHFGKAISAVREVRFFGLVPLLGLLLLGPVAMLVARLRGRPRGPDWRFAVLGLGFAAAATLVWVLLMFGGPNANTIVHQGSLAVPLLAAAACVAGACAVDLRFGAGLVAVNVALVLVLYVPALTPPPGSAYSPVAALLAAISLAGIAALCLRPLKP